MRQQGFATVRGCGLHSRPHVVQGVPQSCVVEHAIAGACAQLVASKCSAMGQQFSPFHPRRRRRCVTVSSPIPTSCPLHHPYLPACPLHLHRSWRPRTASCGTSASTSSVLLQRATKSWRRCRAASDRPLARGAAVKAAVRRLLPSRHTLVVTLYSFLLNSPQPLM